MILVITGGTGSLGSELIRQQDVLINHGITKIRAISRDEQKQVSLTRSYKGEIPLDCFLGDVCDHARMQFALRDAHFVIHTAAQKHVEKFELDVPTGYQTNIVGTQNVASAFMNSVNAVSAMFVSTDKAASPITAYGVSKLAAEHAWLWNNSYQKKIKFGVTRYGNVFGSRGSVIETWTEKSKRGETIKITDERCTRFFMTIQDAAKFVLSSLFKNNCGLHVPEMKSANMVDVARVIWNKFQTDPMKMESVGMRSVEKLHEVLVHDGPSSELANRLTEEEIKSMYEAWAS